MRPRSTRSAELLRERIDDGTLMCDPSRSYYIYELTQAGHTQTGVVAVCSIDEYEQGIIKRHENTRAEKERDRIEHIRALGVQTGPIFLTYRDEPVLTVIIEAAKGATPLYDFTDDESVRQRVWRVRRPESVEAIYAMFEHVPCAYIADGTIARPLREGGARAARAGAAAGTFTGKEPSTTSSRCSSPQASSPSCRTTASSQTATA